MGFWMVVVACRKIGLALEFHFIIWRSASNLETKLELKMNSMRHLDFREDSMQTLQILFYP